MVDKPKAEGMAYARTIDAESVGNREGDSRFH